MVTVEYSVEEIEGPLSPTTLSTDTGMERGSKGSLEGYLGYPENQDRVKRQHKMWWVVNGIAAVGAALWLAGALGIVGRGGEGSGWEAQGWNEMYSHVPGIGQWLYRARWGRWWL